MKQQEAKKGLVALDNKAESGHRSEQNGDQPRIVGGMKDPVFTAIATNLTKFYKLTKAEQKEQLQAETKKIYDIVLAPIVVRDDLNRKLAEVLSRTLSYLTIWFGKRRKGWVEARTLFNHMKSELEEASGKPKEAKRAKRPVKIIRKKEVSKKSNGKASG